jgi:hypothetical protein
MMIEMKLVLHNTNNVSPYFKKYKCFPINMADVAGGSGAGGGDRGSSRRKGKTPVSPREKSKKPGAWVRAQLRYLEKEHEQYVARGEEPSFDIEDLLRCYASSPPNPEVLALPSSSAPAKNPSDHFAFPPKGG